MGMEQREAYSMAKRRNSAIMRMQMIAIFAVLLQSLCFGTDLNFLREMIHIQIAAQDTFEVSGTYIFAKAAGIGATRDSFILLYPFPIDSLMDYPSSIAVYAGHDKSVINFQKNKDGILFRAPFFKMDKCTVNVAYAQHTRAMSGRYILKTTQSWKTALLEAWYSITIPNRYILSFLSYEFDSAKAEGDSIRYSFYRKNFWPMKDIDFLWKESQK
jgi:hypothetical protein